MACCVSKTASRREWMRTVTLGGGAMLLTSLPLVARAGETEALLLTCMDYRLEAKILAYMDGRGMRDKYDHVVLAGASLGALTDKRPDWGRTFFEHLDVAIQLHHIKKVIVLDHRDCGAYKTFLGAASVATPAAETAAHENHLHQLRAAILKAHPKLQVELAIMALDGKVQAVA